MSKNKNVVEQHGCIVCGKPYSLLVVYRPGGRLLDFTVTSGDGHGVQDAHWPLVACNTHTAAEIEAAYTKWRANREPEEEDEEED